LAGKDLVVWAFEAQACSVHSQIKRKAAKPQ
jgi:hypothetical protein